jgi:DNA polymerase I-like protein with 3'-5' exonuclease and polymerase domains
MGRRNKQFADPDALVPQQTSLFCAPKPKYEPYPKIYRHSREAFLGVLERAGEYIGYDLEFDPRRPTILGISNDAEAASLPWDAELARKVRSAGKPLVAFSTVSADKAVADKALGVNSGLNEWEDAMITHYLDNSHLTKAPGKEEDDDPGSMGFMSLGVAVSISTDLPIYKEHRGRDCEGPCPKCDVFGYNAIDAWAGLEVFKNTTASMKRKGIPHSLYRETLELSEVLMKMQQKGVMIDREHVARFNQEQTERKERLFTNIPGKKKHKDQSEMEGIEAFESSAFNPKSPKQIKEYFYRHGILLADTDKNTLEKELAKQSLKAGIQLLQGSDRFSLVEEAYENEKLAGPHLELFKLYTYKSAGKGIDPWFSPKYMDKVGGVHPRFNYTAACTGRLSSSGPNFQNIPKRGLMGNALRKAVIARLGYKILKADYSQLELRIVLWLAGVDPKEAGKDAFAYFVKRAKGRFDEAAARYSMKPRDVAKSTVHGCN